MVLFYWRRQQDVERYKLEQRALQICEVSDINGRSYRQVCAKSIIYRELHNRGYSLSEIGRMFHCNHTSVYNLLNKYDDKVRYDKEFKMLVDKFNNYGIQSEY
jgi:DNA invertase Pin-like site-specific DNA recombinase